MLAEVLIAFAIGAAVALPRVLTAPSANPKLGFFSAGAGSSPPTHPAAVVHVTSTPLPPKRQKHPEVHRAVSRPTRRVVQRVVVRKITVQKAQTKSTVTPAHTPSPHVRQHTHTRTHSHRHSHPKPRPPVTVVASQLGPGTTSCDGTFAGTGQDVVVPAGATCVLEPGSVVAHDLTVSAGGTLIAGGISVGHDLDASDPLGMAIGGDSVGHDLRIDGISGSAGGGGNYIRDTTVGHDLVVEDGLSSASQLTVGCAGGGNSVGHDLVVADNENTVTVADNSVGHDTRVD